MTLVCIWCSFILTQTKVLLAIPHPSSTLITPLSRIVTLKGRAGQCVLGITTFGRLRLRDFHDFKASLHTHRTEQCEPKQRGFCTSSSVLQKETLLGRHRDVELEDMGK